MKLLTLKIKKPKGRGKDLKCLQIVVAPILLHFLPSIPLIWMRNQDTLSWKEESESGKQASQLLVLWWGEQGPSYSQPQVKKRMEIRELHLQGSKSRGNLGPTAELGLWEGAALQTGLMYQKHEIGMVRVVEQTGLGGVSRMGDSNATTQSLLQSLGRMEEQLNSPSAPGKTEKHQGVGGESHSTFAEREQQRREWRGSSSRQQQEHQIRDPQQMWTWRQLSFDYLQSILISKESRPGQIKMQK